MEARLQRRIQRYGWDLAVDAYHRQWREPLAPMRAALLDSMALQPGESVLDLACGTGEATFAAARAVGASGRVLGIDLSGAMAEACAREAARQGLAQVQVARMDAERLALPDASVDAVLCVLGLMYLPEPGLALREVARVLRPGGRVGLVVWGERSRCGWSSVFGIVDDEVRSEVCPLFFALGQGERLAQEAAEAGLAVDTVQRRDDVLAYASDAAACEAAFVGGPVALAWSRFDGPTRDRACSRYLDSVAAWRDGSGWRLPVQYVQVVGRRPG